MENFVLNGNGQIDINRKGMDNGYTFHLQEINHNTEICSNKDVCDDTATSISSYSNYKQRIDAMFDDSRSILSDMSRSNKKLKLPMNLEMCKERVFANNIQEKIEKMFEEISINGIQRQNSTMIRPGQNDEKSSISRHDFLVTYLGSKPLLDKNVSLMSLQDPLKELYFEYKRNPPKDQANVLTISKEGLKIKISEKEKLNPFPTIAVWASVKLSLRMTSTTREYAFLPLITDPDGVDKNLLFRELKSEDFQEQINDDNQSPIFAVVMKNITMNKQLECHGFICRSSEEAIVIAANLYQALMKKLKRKKEHKEVQKIKKESDDSVVEVPEPKPKVKVKKQAPPVPERSSKTPEPIVENEKKEEEPPQTQSEKTDTKPDEKIGRISQRRGSVPVNTHNEPAKTLRRTVSDRGGNAIMVKNHSEGGDILTKVAIPRSRSFLNANGPHSRYSGRNKTNPKNELVSPLGLKELFNEFRLHEGLESMDDILNAIIDAEGMSFNDLKPIYKEFLLKLAVTLTKDELYQRSKTIMRRQKKRSRNCSFRKKAFMSSIGLNKLFRKRLGKSKSPRPTNLEFTSIVFQSTSKQFDSNLPNIKKRKSNSFRVKRKQSSRRRLAKRLEKAKNKNISTTSEDSDFFQPVRNANDSGGGPNRASSGYFSCSECSCDSENCTCTRTDKCYCTLGHKKSYNASSSDESRFCTKKKWSFHPNADQEPEDSLRSCSCDTETCGDSGKCYCTPNKNKWIYGKKVTNLKGVCQTPHLHQREKLHNGSCPGHVITGFRKPGESLFDQLKEQGFAASDTTVSRAASPINWQPNERNVKQKMRLKPATSVELLQNTSKEFLLPVCTYPNHFLKEIQNTPDRKNYFDNARHSCIRASDMGIHKRDFHSCGRRQYSSMRCRSDFLEDLTNLPPLHRSVSYRTKNLFSSVRSKHSCDSIMNHIKFPNCANSSLRFTRRMDVYNSFSENKRFNRRNDLICQYKENRRGIQEQGLLSDDSDIFYHGNKNLQRLDYNIFTKPERCDSRISKKKVLVVSARDPKGNVLYMGTSNRCESSLKNRKNYSDNNSATASEALAVKKSAEIAALFSDVTSKPKLILDYAKDQKHNNRRARSSSFRSTNLENTLGYLP